MTQTLLAIGIPTLAVLVGILMNRSDASRLDGRITALDGRITSLGTDLRSEIADLRSEMAEMRSQLHNDIMVLTGIAREHEGRISRLEERA